MSKQFTDSPATEADLIAHCIQFMADKEDIETLFENTPMRHRPTDSYEQSAEEFLKHPDSLSIDRVRSLLRVRWTAKRGATRVEDLLANLKSGMLEGHDWHKARPSMLHLSIQNMVRDCLAGTLGLADYLSKGTDIIKHEYFMTAIHDVCETSIIRDLPDVIPPTRQRSVSDFVLDDIPYDLKVTTITSNPEKWKEKAGRMTLDDKKQLAKELYEGADSERMRKQAEQCRHNWGLNRMYYVVGDQGKWLKDPEGTVRYLLEGVRNKDNFFEIDVGEYRVRICLVEQ